MKKINTKNRKCKYEGCNNPSAPGKTVCWMHSKREYRANVKLKKEYQEFRNTCSEFDLTDIFSFEYWKGLRND